MTVIEYEPAFYTDGTPVLPGDRIRYQQAPGGLLPPSGEWRYGTAVIAPETHTLPGRLPNLVMQADEDQTDIFGSRGGLYGIIGHIIERSER